MQKLTGKTAVITGASKGLGRAMALALGREGARLILVSRNLEQTRETAQAVNKAGGSAEAFQTDVTDEEQVASLQKKAAGRYGKINILINNAGINIRKAVTDFTLSEWNQVQASNLTSAFLMCRAFVPEMKGQGYGRIINLTSIMSHVSIAGRTAYSSSKAGLLGFTKALALELASEKITVNGISPGPVGTDMNKPIMENPELNQQFISKIPLGRWGKEEEIGQLAVYLCSEDASFITGTDVLIDGGWTAQ
ncbi:MAG TPA: SDR family NAD(P)-dependent oxidoreductase [Candidatus Saccharimonadales bacterium]|nr:SDR family NAD(P)-dependent oxidoreductase [Candidatus Saccharimonadales bacterium]